MAGEIKDSYSFSFQADSLHSGSISFGRFESEPLSWERRSSFSHNRYLEEVEKCSKPGSVIEKKAYFEAHFKKKGLPRPSSYEHHSGTEYQTSENDVLESVSSREEFGHLNEGSHYAYFDESPEGSKYHGEYEVTESETENPGVSFSAAQIKLSLNNADVVVHGVIEDVNAEETHQTETGSDKLLSVNDESEIKVSCNLNGDAGNAEESSKVIANDEPEIKLSQNLNGDAVNAEKSPKGIDCSPKTEPAAEFDETSLEHWQNPSPKLRTAMETKPSKPQVKSQANVVRVQNDASKDPLKNPSTRQRESPLRTNTQKHASQTAIPTTPSVCRTLKLEDSSSQKVKSIHGNKSGEKESRRNKVGESQPSSLKAEPRGSQTANRLNQTVNLTKPDARPSAAAFSFKSDERAERRKEFYVKLEEKMHAKEAEMNQIHVRRQENKEAEIKQFRKSLNFKATPMPSFYHRAVPPGSDGNKVVLSNNKVSKARSKPTNPGSVAVAGSPSSLKAPNDQAAFTSESINTNEAVDDASEESNCSTAEHFAEESNCSTVEHFAASAVSWMPSTKRSCHPEGMTKIEVIVRKEREKLKNLQKHCVSESQKTTKGQRVEGKQKVAVRRSSKDMARKDMKGIGHLAVGVAS